MDNFELNDFNKRIGLNTDLKDISLKICESYELGEFISNDLIKIGYEDYNYYLTTSEGKFCVKIFNKSRSKENLDAYLDRIRTITRERERLSTPRALSLNGDIVYRLDYKNNHYDICVFEYVDGKNYFELGEKPSIEAIKQLARETASINKIDYKPEFIYDSWAIVNFEKEYREKRKYLSDEYRAEFDALLNEYSQVDIDKLPKAFVHGDIITTNILKGADSKIWIVDFAVSNYLPRIIDLAVTSCNPCLDENSCENTIKRIEVLVSEYNKYSRLTPYELEVFWIFYKLANAMHILQTIFIAETEGDSDENRYWLNEGVVGYSYANEVRNLSAE